MAKYKSVDRHKGVRLAIYLYILGLILFLASLFSPAYSPYGAWNYTGWEAVNAALQLRPRMLLDFGRVEDIIAIIVIAISALNSVFVVVSPLLFPFRRKINRKRWFWGWVTIGLSCTFFIIFYMHYVGFIHVLYGYYLWLASLVLVYLSFHPALSKQP